MNNGFSKGRLRDEFRIKSAPGAEPVKWYKNTYGGRLLYTESQTVFFAYPTDIRKVIYTTNAIESLNSVIRHAIKKRKVFPTDDSVKKVVWLAIQSASRKWTMPLKDWRMAMSRFIIEFGDRLGGHF